MLRPSRLVAAIVALGLVACAPEAPLPPPGAQGPILIREWDGKGRRQIVVKAATVEHPERTVGKEFDQMDLGQVLIRLPHRDDVVCIASPTASYRAKGSRLVDLVGPVNISGTLQGATVIGCATQAWLNADDQSLELVDLRLTTRGTLSSHPRVRMRQEQAMETSGASSAKNAPVLAVSALAALPQPFVIPDLTAR